MEDKMKKTFLIVSLILTTFLATANLTAAAPQPGEEGINYVLIFQITEYNSKIGDAVDFFMNKMLRPNDQLILLSPAQLYNFSPQTRQKNPIPALVKQTQKVLKKDTTMGAAGYDQVLNSMIRVVQEISSGNDPSYSMSGGGGGNDMKIYMVQYRQLLENMRELRKLNEKFFIDISGKLKNAPGKSVFYVFYQKELRAIPNRTAMDNLQQNVRYKFDAVELFLGESDEEFINVARVVEVLNASDITLNFVYLNKQGRRRQGMEFKEFSGDVYNVFSKLAKGTGGFVEATSKPAAVLKKISKSK